MRGSGEYIIHGPRLGNPAAVHHDNVVAHVGDDTQVVRDEDDGHAHLLLERVHELKNLRLDGDIQGGGRFVRDHDRGLAGESHCNDDTLAHAAGKLMGVFSDPDFRRGDADLAEHINRHLERLLSVGGDMQKKNLAQLSADRLDRIEGGHRLLEDHADAAAADATHFLWWKRREIPAVKQDLAAPNLAHRLWQQPHDRQRGHTLAAARFADDAKRAAPADRKADAVDRGEHLKRRCRTS